MKKKQRITSLAGLLTIPVTPVVNKTGWQTKAEFFAAEKDLAEKPTRDAIAIQEDAYRKLRKLASEFWSRPIGELQLSIYQDSAKDVTFDAPPVVRESYSREDLIAACDQWHDSSFVHSGYNLNPDGVMRLCCFGESQARAGVDFSQPLAWEFAFFHLKDNLKAFAVGELDSSKVPRAEPPAEPQPQIEDIENLALESTDGRKQALKIVEELASAEASVICGQWLEHLKRDYDFTPDTKQINEVVRWFNFNAKNWLGHKCYDECRRALVSQGIFPAHLLTNDEIVCQEIERDQTPLMKMGFDDRRNLRTKILRLTDRV